MRNTHLRLLLLLCIYLIAGAFSATIFDHRKPGRKVGLNRAPSTSISDKFKRLETDTTKRHINTLRVLSSNEKEEYTKRLEDKTQKFNDDTSNERNIWRSHPLKPDFDGPDTASVMGLGFA